MKDRLPKGWDWKKLGEVGDVRMCKRILKKQTLPVGDIPFYKIGTFGKNPDAYISNKIYQEYKSKYPFPKKGDILLSASGTIGRRVIYNGEPAYFQDSNIVWISNDEKKVINNYLYLFYSFCNWNPTTGATISRLYNNDLRNIQIPIPSLSEQKQIVSVLDKTFEKLDQAISLVKENIHKLKRLNESVLDEVFRNSDKFIPFLDYISVNRKTITPEHKEEYNIIGLENIESNSGKLINFKPITGSQSISNKVIFKKGDILYGKLRPYLNKVYLAEFEGIATTEIIPFTVDKNVFIEKFVLYFLRSPFFLEKVNLSCSGARMPRVTTEFWKTLFIPFLLISEQQYIVTYLDQTTEKNYKLIQYYQNKLEALKKLKNSILYSAFNGELKKTKIISISSPTIDPFLARKKDWNAKKNADKQVMIIALAMEAHEKIGKSLYRTKGEKTVEIIEKHIDLDFGREAKKMAAGPAAFEYLVKVVEPLAKEKKWFSIQEVKGENYDSHKYIKAENFNAFMMRCVLDLRPNLQEIRRVVELFANMKTTHEAEVVATTYSGWNNLIIRKIQINDEAIVTEARENWHDSKLKIERQEFFNAIEWLKNNNLIPQGNGREVI